jgi:hypothetical protein
VFFYIFAANNKNFNSGEFIKFLKEKTNETEIIFEQCVFDNFASCIKTAAKNQSKYFKSLKKITFIDCYPESEIESYKLSAPIPGLEVAFQKHHGLHEVHLKSGQQAFLTILRRSFIGFSVKYYSVFTFVMHSINFFIFLTSANNFHMSFSNYLLQNFKEKKPIVSNEANRHIAFHFSKSYFKHFQEILHDVLETECFAKYNIVIFKDAQQAKMAKFYVINNNKNLNNLFSFFMSNSIESLFFNLSNPFLNTIDKYIYLPSESKLKPEIYQVILHTFRYIKLKNIHTIALKDQQKIHFTTVNDRDVMIWNIAKINIKKALSKVFSLEECDLLEFYQSHGIDFIISKLIHDNQLTEDEAIVVVVDNLLSYLEILL